MIDISDKVNRHMHCFRNYHKHLPEWKHHVMSSITVLPTKNGSDIGLASWTFETQQLYVFQKYSMNGAKYIYLDSRASAATATTV